jgi:hypothetical protein
MRNEEVRSMERSTVYFDEPGKGNTAETLRIALERARELGIRQVIVASTHGGTARAAADLFRGTGIEIISVSISAAFDDQGWTITPAERKTLEERGVRVLTGLHALADGVAEGFSSPAAPGSVVADTLRWFSQGTKVAVETSIMAVEAGLAAEGVEVIAMGGTNEGADTAIVIRPAFARKAKAIRVCEILCKPRIA